MWGGLHPPPRSTSRGGFARIPFGKKNGGAEHPVLFLVPPLFTFPAMDPIDKADVLIEALPYLQAFRGKTFLIKMGGSAMENPELVSKVMRDIVFLEVAGINPIVVHGGGKAISAAMEKAGLEAKFVGGFRVRVSLLDGP